LKHFLLRIVVGRQEINSKMSTHGINAIGMLIGNPDEIIFVLTKGDVERVYNKMNNLVLGTPLPESVWSSFKENMYRLDDRLDHAEALEDILAEYCRIPVTIAPPPPAPTLAAPPAPMTVAPPPPSSSLTLPALSPVPPPAVDNTKDYDKLQRKKYNTQKFQPPGYGHHVVWSAHRVRAFMVALKQKPTVYDANLRTLAQIAGVHPYDFRWKTNPVSFGKKNGLSEMEMRRMMGKSYDDMVHRFSVHAW